MDADRRRCRRGNGLIIVAPSPCGSRNAYASWTPTPSPVAAVDLDVVAHACRKELGDHSRPVGGLVRLGHRWPWLSAGATDLVTVQFHQNNPDVAVPSVATTQAGSPTSIPCLGTGASGGPAWSPAADRIAHGAIAHSVTRHPRPSPKAV